MSLRQVRHWLIVTFQSESVGLLTANIERELILDLLNGMVLSLKSTLVLAKISVELNIFGLLFPIFASIFSYCHWSSHIGKTPTTKTKLSKRAAAAFPGC